MAAIGTPADPALASAEVRRPAAAGAPDVDAVPLTSPRLSGPRGLRAVLWDFVHDECIPAEAEYAAFLEAAPPGRRFAAHPPVMAKLKARAQALGLWNLWMTHEYPQSEAKLTLSEYAVLAEIMGRCPLASEACNCAAPDTGNMEVLAKYGSAEQRATWLAPLLAGDIRSAFLMTEPDVASSDATNIGTSIVRDGNEYVINGTKWWSTGACNPDCKVAIVSACCGNRWAPCRHPAARRAATPLQWAKLTLQRPLIDNKAWS